MKKCGLRNEATILNNALIDEMNSIKKKTGEQIAPGELYKRIINKEITNDKITSLMEEFFAPQNLEEGRKKWDVKEIINMLRADKVKKLSIGKYEGISLKDFDVDSDALIDYIENVCGGDRTKGSCASLAFCFAGHVAGLDVKDFRGGQSQDFFSSSFIIDKIASLRGVDGIVKRTNTEVKTTIEILKDNVKNGKLYFLGAGRHASIVTKTEEYGFLYLEQQSNYSNGWKQLDEKALRNRFACTKNSKYTSRIEFFEIEKLAKKDGLEDILEFINTEESKQQKGNSGGIK